MHHHNSILHWETLLDDTEWDRDEPLSQLLRDQQQPETAPVERSYPAFCLSAITLCILLIAGAATWVRARQGVIAIESEIEEVVAIENWLAQTENLSASVSSSGDGAQAQAVTLPSSDFLMVKNTTLRPGQAMAHIRVEDAFGNTYNETRFYLDSPHGWVSSDPLTDFWGGAHSLETEYFVIYYRHADAEAVMTAATQLDEIYVELCRDLGLPPDAQKLQIEVLPETLTNLMVLGFHNGKLVVPSPLLQRIPENLSASDTLLQSITHQLVTDLWIESYQYARSDGYIGVMPPIWTHMRSGLQLWQVQASNKATQRTVATTTRWLYQDAPSLASRQREPTVHDMKVLCDAGRLWSYGYSPAITPASLCADPNWLLSVPSLIIVPDTIDYLQQTTYCCLDGADYLANECHGSFNWPHSIAAAALVDYYVDAYGRDQLPDFISALHTHNDWDSLTQDLLGVPAAEFEAGWLDYLAEVYSYAP